MACFVLDFVPSEWQLQPDPIDGSRARDWLNKNRWQSCISDQNVKAHVAELCVAKRAELDTATDPPARLGPGDEALFIQRSRTAVGGTSVWGENRPKRVNGWDYAIYRGRA